MRCDDMLSLGQNHRDARQALIIHTGNCYEPCAQTIHMLMVKDYQEQHRVWLLWYIKRLKGS
jgi:hypothetical protein